MSKDGKYKEGITALLSRCCNAEVKAYHSDEGTSYWYCSYCVYATDPIVPVEGVYNKTHPTGKSYFDLPDEEKKQIMDKAANDSNKAQRELMNTPTTQSLEELEQKIIVALNLFSIEIDAQKYGHIELMQFTNRLKEDVLGWYAQEQKRLLKLVDEKVIGKDEKIILEDSYKGRGRPKKGIRVQKISVRAEIGNVIRKDQREALSQLEKELV